MAQLLSVCDASRWTRVQIPSPHIKAKYVMHACTSRKAEACGLGGGGLLAK